MNWSKKNVLVTGGAGAIGSNLVKALLARGCQNIYVLDDLSSGRKDNLLDGPEVHFLHDTIVNDEILERIFQENITVVFHLAANFANQNSVDFPRLDLTTNGMGTLKLLEYARKVKVERFVYISSSCVYGNKNTSLHEDDLEYNLDTPYAITKLLGERYITFFHKHDRLKTVILRYFNAYGPGEFPGKYRNVIPNFFALALQGQPLPITGTGEETRDFTFNGDTVEGTVRAAEYKQAIGKIINIGSGRETKIVDLAEKINRLTGNTAGIVFKERRSWDLIQRRVASIEIAKKVLAYHPSVDLDEGLNHTFSWLQTVLKSSV